MNRRILLVLGLIAIYYVARYWYYKTFLPHAYLAKKLLPYYHNQYLQTLHVWQQFALIVPLVAIIGIFMERRLWLLGVYILLSSVTVLMGLHSDWERYSVHLLPLMLIVGLPALKNKYITIVVCSIMIWQGHHSIQWMYRNAANLAPCQAIRTEAGKWLQDNADKSQWVISSDIGAIAYKAKDCKFIDLNGLTSRDIMVARKNHTNLTDILRKKHPMYIADTFITRDKELIYNHPEIKQYLNDVEFNIKIRKQWRDDIAIIVGELR